MEGDAEAVTIVNKLFGEVTVVSRGLVSKKSGAKNICGEMKRLNAATNTNNNKRRSYVTHASPVPSYVTYRAQINLTTVKPTLQECGYINALSKDTRYFAQTLRKYPLPKPQTKSSDLIQEKIRRTENKPGWAYKKAKSKIRNVRKTASHQAFKSNIVYECNVQDAQRLSKVEEILPTTTKIKNTSDNATDKYNYLNSKTKLSNVDVRYCTSTKRACTCKRMNNVICTRPENCPNVQHRIDHHRQFYHGKKDGKKPSCRCNVCQGSREAPSTSRLSPSEYENRQEQDEEIQLLSRNYLESSHEAVDYENKIRQWTEAKLNNSDVVQTKLIQKLAKALNGLTKDTGFLPEAKHEVVKYLTALSIIDPGIKDNLGYLADDFLDNLTKSSKNVMASKTSNDPNVNENFKTSSVNRTKNQSNENELKMFIKHFLKQLPIQKDDIENDQLDAVVEKFLNILKEHKIKQIGTRELSSTGQYENKDYYLNRILSWWESMPDLKQQLKAESYENIRHFQDLANKLGELNKGINIEENADKVKEEIMQWFKNYFTVYNVSDTESLLEKVNDKLVIKLFGPTKENTNHKGLLGKDWITKEIYTILEDNRQIPLNENALELVNSLLVRLSYVKEKNNGNLTLHQCENELKLWLEYLRDKQIVHFEENNKTELEYKILSRIKVLLRHEKHTEDYHLKRLRLLTKIIIEEINRSLTDNNINISQEKLLHLLSDFISLVFKMNVNEKLITKKVYEKVCTILYSILNLPADDVKGLVKSILDKIISSWKNVAKTQLKESNKIEDSNDVDMIVITQTDYPSKKVYKSEFVTSTPRQSEEGFFKNFDGNSTSFSKLINENGLQSIIKDWLEANKLKLNETEKQNIIKEITRDIVCRYNYAKAFSKTRSDLDELEYLKYFVFKVLGDYMKEQTVNNSIISEVNNLHNSINKTLIPHGMFEEPEMNNKNHESLEILKSKLVNAFINLNSYLVDERFESEYKGKLKEQINKISSKYFQRFPATPLDTEELHSNIYSALDNVPKPPQTKSEIDIIHQIKNWLDELCKENNLPNKENENIILDLAKPLLQNKKSKPMLHDNEYDLSQTISQWVQNYSKKHKAPLNAQYWTHKLVEKLKTLDSFREPNLSKATSTQMYTIPAAESFGAQIDESIMNYEDKNESLAEDLLTVEERELLSKVKNRSTMPDNIVKSQTDMQTSDKPEPALVPDVRVREYQWESVEQTQTFQHLPPDEMEEIPPESLQAQGIDHSTRMTFADLPEKKSDQKDVDEPMIPEKLQKPKSHKNKTYKLRKRPSANLEPSKVYCPNRLTLKSKRIDKFAECSCSDCVINKHRIKNFCAKSDNVDVKNCPECFGGYCPFPSCAYFE